MPDNNLTNKQAKAIEKFFIDTTLIEARKIIDQTFHDSLSADVLDGPQNSDVLFQLNRIKDLLEALEPVDKKRQRLQEELKSI